MTETTATQTHPATSIEADPDLPTIRITREFDAPREQVFTAWTDPVLVSRWLGPRSVTTDIQLWDLRTGGSWRYQASRCDTEELLASFYGSFHEVRPNERIVQTFTFEGFPDGVSLETATFEDAGDRRTRLTIMSVVETMEMREAILASGMDVGVIEGFEQLDEILAARSDSES